MDESNKQRDADGEVMFSGEEFGQGRKYFSSIVEPLQIEKMHIIHDTAAVVAPDPDPEAGKGGHQNASEEGREGRAGKDPEEPEGGPHHGLSDSPRNSTGEDALSADTEKMIVNRIEELSQLHSPILRELAKRLEKKFNLQDSVPKPKPKPKRTSKLGKESTRESTRESVRHPYSSFHVGTRWQEIQGSKSWKGLLDPIDHVLRSEIVRYGEFAEACYDSFDADVESKYCGSCKHIKEELLEKVGLENRGYEVTDYLYATADLGLPNFFTRSLSKDSWSRYSNWMGFVAVSTSPEEIVRLGRRDILIAWRGTVTRFEWIKDLQDFLSPVGFDPRLGHLNVRVEKGFLSLYTSANEKSRYNKTSVRVQVLGAVKRLVDKYKHEGNLSITITGHSLGGALATLCAYDIAQTGMNPLLDSTPSIPNRWDTQTVDRHSSSDLNLKSQTTEDQNPGQDSEHAMRDIEFDANEDEEDGEGGSRRPSGASAVESEGNSYNSKFQNERIPITVFSLGGPRVGNLPFKRRVEELGVAVLRVQNKHDLVTKVPGAIRSKLLVIPGRSLYRHVGEVLQIDHLISPFLQEKTSAKCSHTLEGYLHVLDGFHGTGMRFHPTLRDFALVNKRCNFLKKKYYIPSHWWQDENKGLRRDNYGHWSVPKRDSEIFPESPVPSADDQEKVGSDGPKGSFWRNVNLALKGRKNSPEF